MPREIFVCGLSCEDVDDEKCAKEPGDYASDAD
jgi:hypothetical protein